jgi:hypothetical protein
MNQKTPKKKTIGTKIILSIFLLFIFFMIMATSYWIIGPSVTSSIIVGTTFPLMLLIPWFGTLFGTSAMARVGFIIFVLLEFLYCFVLVSIGYWIKQKIQEKRELKPVDGVRVGK